MKIMTNVCRRDEHAHRAADVTRSQIEDDAYQWLGSDGDMSDDMDASLCEDDADWFYDSDRDQSDAAGASEDASSIDIDLEAIDASFLASLGTTLLYASAAGTHCVYYKRRW